MSGEVSLPRRKSAQRAGNSLKKYVVFQSGGGKEENSDDSAGFVGDQISSDSSSDNEIEVAESNEDGGASADEELTDEGETLINAYNRRRSIWDTAAALRDIREDNMGVYGGNMSFLEPVSLEPVEYDEQINISVNGERLSAFSSIDSEDISVGYAGGTAVLARWIPNSTFVCLAVCNSSHIVTYKSPIIDSIQLWSYEDGKLTFLYSLKVPVFYDLVVYPYRTGESSSFTLCISCQNCVRMFSLPTKKPDGSALHFRAEEPSLLLKIGTCNNNLQVAKLNWAMFNDKVHLLGGLNNGYIVVWTIGKPTGEGALFPSQRVWAHHGHPISDISVFPQTQNLFCTIAQDSRVKFWDLKNLRYCLYSQTRPNKQLLLPSQSHWCSFWGSVLVLSMMPVREISSNRVHANTSLWQLSTAPLHNPSQKALNVLLPRIFCDDLNGIFPRCFDFCDATSTLVIGFQLGRVALFRVSNLWILPHSKEKCLKSGNFLYLNTSATAKINVDVSKEFKDDQDFINHFEFSLPMKLSSTSPPNLSSAPEFSRKSLTSVTHVELQKFDSTNKSLCVNYMSGLFQVLKPPESLSDPKNTF